AARAIRRELTGLAAADLPAALATKTGTQRAWLGFRARRTEGGGHDALLRAAYVRANETLLALGYPAGVAPPPALYTIVLRAVRVRPALCLLARAAGCAPR